MMKNTPPPIGWVVLCKVSSLKKGATHIRKIFSAGLDKPKCIAPFVFCLNAGSYYSITI